MHLQIFLEQNRAVLSQQFILWFLVHIPISDPPLVGLFMLAWFDGALPFGGIQCMENVKGSGQRR